MPALRPVPDTAPRAILYLRQSVARDDSVSLDLQETAGRDYCARMGYDVVDVVSDPGRTGRTLARRQVIETIERIKQREAEIVVVWRWSRLARNRRDFAVTCDHVESLGGRVESATEPIDVRTASGRLARGMMAEVAAWESELRGEVWKEVHARRRSHGIPAQGGRRYGYLHERGTNTYAPDPATAPLLVDMYRQYLAGVGFPSIAFGLNAQGVPNQSGRPWTANGVTVLLDSGFAAGKLIHHKRGSSTGARHYADGAHPPLLTPEEWDRYLRVRRSRLGTYHGTEPVYMLSGLIRCGDCGSPMHSNRLGRETGYGYICSRYQHSRVCRCITVSRARAERAIAEFVTDVGADVDGETKREMSAAEARLIARSETDDLTRRIARADERMNRLTAGWTEGLVPDAAYRATRDEILALRTGLCAELDAAKEREVRVPTRPRVPAALVGRWGGLAAGVQRPVLVPLVDHLEVHRSIDPCLRGRKAVWLELVTTWGERLHFR